MEIKTNCYCYNEKNKECGALKELYCAKEECRFYKTRAQVLEQYRKATENELHREQETIEN